MYVLVLDLECNDNEKLIFLCNILMFEVLEFVDWLLREDEDDF